MVLEVAKNPEQKYNYEMGLYGWMRVMKIILDRKI